MNWLKKVNALQTSDTCNLVKKTDYNTKINETEKKLLIMINNIKYITTLEFNKLIAENLRLEQAN